LDSYRTENECRACIDCGTGLAVIFELPTRNPSDKLTCLRGCAKSRDHGSLPGPHQGVTVVEDTGDPNFGKITQSAPSDHGVNVRVEL
jgi:hypothetical protein